MANRHILYYRICSLLREKSYFRPKNSSKEFSLIRSPDSGARVLLSNGLESKLLEPNNVGIHTQKHSESES